MKINNLKLRNIIKDEIKNLLNEAPPVATKPRPRWQRPQRHTAHWSRGLDLAEPVAMGMVRRGEAIAPSAKSVDRYPHFSHINQALKMIYQELKKLKDDLEYEWKKSFKGLFAKEGYSAEILKYTSDVNKALQKIEKSDYITRRDVIDESFPNIEWVELRALLQGEGGLEDILEDTVLTDERFARITELFSFAVQVVNARIESSAAGTTGFKLDPAGIRALRKIPSGISYEKPEVE
jgi:hypothetical protein